ncbi:MAG: hypothetical protein ACLT1A_14620 [Dysosmobacter sp.]
MCTFRIGSACRTIPPTIPAAVAAVWSGERLLGVFGQIHPLVARNYGVDARILLRRAAPRRSC